jgi:hypothetical protein
MMKCLPQGERAVSHEHETPTDGGAAAKAATTEPRPEARPDFLDRAKRILGGDVRPDDYLPVTPEVEARVARDFAFAADHLRKRGAAYEIDPNAGIEEFGLSVGARQRNQWLLSLYYGGQNIACIENERGVIVLAVGLEQSAAVMNAFPYEQRKDVMLDTPPLPDCADLF